MDSRVQDITNVERAALARLTEREKDCLRRWLQHQTAKEIAIDLGVSPHAVEKRLKMARAKLGVSTSLEAARLLASYEGYQQSIPQHSDLDNTTPQSKNRQTKPIVFGVIVMSIVAIVLVAALGHLTGPSEEAPVVPKPGEILVAGPISFEQIDTNGSGFLEGQEAPKLVLVGGEAEVRRNADGGIEFSGDYVTIPESNFLRDRFYEEADTDGDGRVSPNEYDRWAGPKHGKG